MCTVHVHVHVLQPKAVLDIQYEQIIIIKILQVKQLKE